MTHTKTDVLKALLQVAITQSVMGQSLEARREHKQTARELRERIYLAECAEAISEAAHILREANDEAELDRANCYDLIDNDPPDEYNRSYGGTE